MRAYKLIGFLALAMLVLALSLAMTACKPSMFRRMHQDCTIKPEGDLKINANISFGGLVIKPIRPSANNRERIEVNGPRGEVREKNGIYEIQAFDETAEVYVDETRSITLTGNLGQDLRSTNHYGPLSISGNVDHIGIMNHKGPLTVQGGSIDILNQQGDLRINQVSESVRITNLKGKLDAEVHGNLELLNHENGNTSITAHGSVQITNQTGNLQAMVYEDFKLLNQQGGNTTVTVHGDVSIQNFDLDLEKGIRFDMLMKTRPEVERVLKAKGHSLHVKASGFRVTRLMNIFAQRIEAGGWGLNILGAYALETTLRDVDGCVLQDIQSPLKMSLCCNGSLNGLKMDYSLENCSEMQVNPRNELGPHGTLKQCRNVIVWNTPADRVSQTGCQQVIFAQKPETSPTPGR